MSSTTTSIHEDPSFYILSKKTSRGRKSTFQLPEGTRCTICLEYNEYTNKEINPLIPCIHCNSHCHINCYNKYSESFQISQESKLSFSCEKCTSGASNETTCFICGMSEGILIKQASTFNYYHPLCTKLINEYREPMSTPLRKWRYKNSCHFCKEKLNPNKPVLKCLNPKCKEYYHIPCAIKKSMLFNMEFMEKFYKIKGKIPFYCSCHNKKCVNSYKEFMYDLNRKRTDCKNYDTQESNSNCQSWIGTDDCLSNEKKERTENEKIMDKTNCDEVDTFPGWNEEYLELNMKRRVFRFFEDFKFEN